MFRATLIDVAIQNGTKIKLKEQKIKTEKNKSTVSHESKKKRKTNEMITIDELIGLQRKMGISMKNARAELNVVVMPALV